MAKPSETAPFPAPLSQNHRDLWVILGASSPICQEFARMVANRGCAVLLAGRHVEILNILAADLRLRCPQAEIAVLKFDANESEDRQKLLQNCRQWADASEANRTHPPSDNSSKNEGSGAIHILLGFAHQEPQEEIEQQPDLAAKVISISLSAAAATVMTMLPMITEPARPSRVIIIASVSGDRGRRSNYVYGAAKAGLIALASGLRSRLYPCGGSVVTAKLGFIDTATTWGGAKIFLAADPKDTAAALLRASDKKIDVLYFPKFWWVIMTIIRLIPESLFKRLPI
ncbi:MAG: SDR family NAD(P)-dependent oxidoreductase [Alphaproteobacteria bacterium]|nr:SDR family NAD(P)-dependent oxidoreductase [Alphaproteobacteria bacterium]